MNIVLILGNGFSIDFISKIERGGSIDLSNLFKNGDKVPWPANDIPGFLSQKYCPELWNLGVRPNISKEKSKKIIEDIITCANVSATIEEMSVNVEPENIYVRAYHELVAYLRYLFIYYNNIVEDSDIENRIKKWGWSNLFKNIWNNDRIENVVIITYNYDVFLERILKIMKIEFQVEGVEENKECKFKIIKPHGSISFRSRNLNDKDIFSIKYARGQSAGALDDLELDDNINNDKISSINTMIPPAGESKRYPYLWSKVLREMALTRVKECGIGDDVIIGGISYCSVDRAEIDEIITSMDKNVNVSIINPDVDNTFDAVISSVFEKYIHYTEVDTIGGLYND